MKYNLNYYAVVEDNEGLHLVPSFRRDRYATVLLDRATVAAAAVWLSTYAAVRGTGDSHEHAVQQAHGELGTRP